MKVEYSFQEYILNEGRYMQPALGFEDDPLDEMTILTIEEQEELLEEINNG